MVSISTDTMADMTAVQTDGKMDVSTADYLVVMLVV